MNERTKVKGAWVHRLAIHLLTLALAVLVFWVLGFVVNDIRSLPGPDFDAIKVQYVDQDLVSRREALEEQIQNLTRRIRNLKEKQQILGDSSRNLQQTINQLIQLRKLGIQKHMRFSETQQANFTNALNLFLENQKKYQRLSQTISDLLAEKQRLVRQKRQTKQAIAQQREPAREKYSALRREHRLTLALWQLAILLPILVIAGIVIISKRGSIYFPLYLAVGAATLVKVTLVIHAYFPTRYFKYILIGVLLVVVARVLIHFIRTVAFPKSRWLAKQYREAYERFLCPVCEYPIRTGPRRYLFWTRRTVNKIIVPGEHSNQDEVYTCPACGQELFEECASCHKIRHTLLPNCLHCGAEA